MCFDMMIKGNYNVNDLIDSNSLYLNIYIENSNNNNWPKLLGFVWIATLVLSGIAAPFKWIMQYKSLLLSHHPCLSISFVCLFYFLAVFLFVLFGQLEWHRTSRMRRIFVLWNKNGSKTRDIWIWSDNIVNFVK